LITVKKLLAYRPTGFWLVPMIQRLIPLDSIRKVIQTYKNGQRLANAGVSWEWCLKQVANKSKTTV